MKFLKYLFLGIIILTVNHSYLRGLPGGLFELGFAARRPFQVEVIMNYYNRTKYYDDEVQKMENFPTGITIYPTGENIDWHYNRAKIKFRLGYNFTYNLRVRFTFPYVYSDLLKSDSINQKIEVKYGSFTDFEVELKYDWLKRKVPLWDFWKSATIYLSYMFDSGSNKLLEDYISLGEDAFLINSFFSFQPAYNKLKDLYLTIKFGYKFNGYKRLYAANYSKSGWKDGNQISYEFRLSYIIDFQWRIDGYFYGKKWYESIDQYGNLVPDTDEFERGIGGIIKYRPFGVSDFEVYFRMWYPIDYKIVYESFINPELGIKYTF